MNQFLRCEMIYGIEQLNIFRIFASFELKNNNNITNMYRKIGFKYWSKFECYKYW